jgi:tetratricopeptide (TPR) repeat protein
MRLRRFDILLVAAMFGCTVVAPLSAIAMGPETNPTLPSSNPPPKQGNATTPAAKKKQKKAAKKQQQSQRDFDKGFSAAYQLIYVDHDYAAGIARLRSLHHDELADVANLIGYSSRKLGRYDDSKYWYERALAADPNHARTWSYYGMWHAEQGNLLKASDYLEKLRTICGTECREYTELKGVIEGTVAY